ncbi:hypothetical protein OBBRIDRAFT_772167 [Obba rivulosa]|uniref:Zn(2)-C6 fungal-type domain-containing protein n=1 Tax=Obba rivulosa TaxID=1052685 RepID=A0A8E2DP53_9APHY|nr:hypothetical protein OBBRIDRAFT_772167 [Obba rivulosa]
MADSPEGSESVGESGDDSQLTIRIPNPKVYMARQSQWKGRRGKPRCDHCRLNNLKCDRVLPSCNHCAWANGRECKYTPLPTPAHRGIPRCDRCRAKNLKCDRNLPICNHCAEDKEDDCNYTPKKRHKVPTDHVPSRDRPVAPYATKTASFLVHDAPNQSNGSSPPESGPKPIRAHYEREMRTEPQIRQYVPPHSPRHGHYDASEVPLDPAAEVAYTETAPDGSVKWVRKYVMPALAPKEAPPGPSTMPHRPFVLDQGMIVTTPHIDPWTHPAFAPLPEVVLQTLRTVNAIEMPSRHSFEESLVRFIGGLSPELRETATFIPEAYAELARAVAEGRLADLQPRLQLWASCHHARSGSRKYNLILLPRDAYYNMPQADEEKLRLSFISQTDGETKAPATEPQPESGLSTLDPAAVFERIPVQHQIYDILVYTHRNHGSTSAMLFEARRIGIATITWPMVEIFVRLCPLCKLRAKGTPRVATDEEALSYRSQVVKR